MFVKILVKVFRGERCFVRNYRKKGDAWEYGTVEQVELQS